MREVPPRPSSASTRVPRPFKMPWGSGTIREEARFSGEWHEPCLQLLEYTDGEAAGSMSIRFCYYSLDGRFQRSPLMLGTDEIEGMREALRSTPALRALLRRLVED